MIPQRLEIWVVDLPLKQPFASATHTLHSRRSVILRMHTDVGAGWGECVAFDRPFYTSEFTGSVLSVIEEFCWPLLRGRSLRADQVGPATHEVKGHRMARAALEMAALDAELRDSGESLAQRLGATRSAVEVGVAVGLQRDLIALLETVGRHVDHGYRRIKLKVEPGHDREPVAAVRAAYGDGLLLQVDANGSYDPEDIAALAALDEFGLLLIEQPFAEDDLLSHARLEAAIETPICLDESISSLSTARQALDLGACSTINLKPGRVGGYLESLRIHDLALDREVPLWCGGMLEMGLARAANLALAALPGFTFPGDISATDRYFDTDLTDPLQLVDGMLTVPDGPGIGVEPDESKLEQFGTAAADLC